MAERDALTPVLTDLHRGDVLIVAKLDRLPRSLADFAAQMDRSAREGWDLVALDLGVDTTTPTGRFVANLMANVRQLECELIGQRIRDALAERKRQGARLAGPGTLPDDVRHGVAREHAAGESLAAIARRLMDEGVATARGGVRWYPSTVQSVVRSVALDAEAVAAPGRRSLTTRVGSVGPLSPGSRESSPVPVCGA
jgi:DNA invertase Pin-like site-specific DNA recombinase